MNVVPFVKVHLRGDPARDKDVRDPVHGDIELREHEQHIVNTAIFQRLHGIRQLGFAYHVYPGASHNRFQHSLGTLHMAQRIAEAIERGAVVPAVAQPSGDDLAYLRVAALIHDIGHIPFGHTLEDEVRVFDERHAAPARLAFMHQRLIDQAACATCTVLIERAGEILRAAEMDEDEYVDAIEAEKETATQPGATKTAAPTLLAAERWYLADIVGNTICADLLDYVRRDGRFCGIDTSFDPKLFRYFTNAPDRTGRLRLALALVKKDKFRIDIVSEIIGVLRLRYTLSERVYHHHAKMAAGAMLGRAVQLSELTPARFYETEDASALALIEAEGERRIREGADAAARETGQTIVQLIQDVRRRHLYKAAYRVTSSSLEVFVRVHKKKVEEAFGKRSDRAALEAEIRAHAGLPEGAVIVSCPSERMAMKETAAMVLWKGSARRRRPGVSQEVAEQLRSIDKRYFDAGLLREVEDLEGKYGGLWSLTVFLHPDHYDAAINAVQRFLRDRLQVPNDPLLAATIREREALEREVRIRSSVSSRSSSIEDMVVRRTGEIMKDQELAAARSAGAPRGSLLTEVEAEDQAWREVMAGLAGEQRPRPASSTGRRKAAPNMRLDEGANEQRPS